MVFHDGDESQNQTSRGKSSTELGSHDFVPQQAKFDAALEQLEEWYDSWRPKPDRETARYVVCVGLAVLHRMREAWPIPRSGYVSGIDVRTSGPLIRNILTTYGIHRMYSSTGGRTSPAALKAAESFVSRMNLIAVDWNLSPAQRGDIIDGLQAWLIVKVERYFALHPLPESTLRGSPPGN